MCASPKRGHSQSKPFSFILCWSYWWWWLMLLRYLSLSNKIIVWTHQAEVLNDIQYCAKVLTYLTFLYILLPRSRSFFEIAFEPINRKQKKVWGLDWITSHNCTYYVTPFIFACFNKSFYLFPNFLVKYKEMKNLQTLCFPLCPPSPHPTFSFLLLNCSILKLSAASQYEAQQRQGLIGLAYKPKSESVYTAVVML